MYKRLISIVCILSLLVCLMVVPAYASDLSGSTQAGTDYIDYLNSDTYLWFVNNIYHYSTTDPNFNLNSANSFKVQFEPSEFVGGVDYILFCLRSDVKPSSVSVRFSGSTSFNSVIFEGRIEEPGEYNYYFYRVNDIPSTEYIEILGNFSSSYTGRVSLYSCFGVQNLLTVYDRADFDVVTITDETEGLAIGKHTDIGTKMFPYTYRNDTSKNLYAADFTIRLDSDRFITTGIDRVSLLLTTYNENIVVSASLVAKDASVSDINNIKVNVSTDHNWGMVNDYEVGAGTVYGYSAFQVDVDLHGYDLEQYELFFYVRLKSVPFVNSSTISNTRLLEVTFRSIQYVPTVASIPWYNPIISSINSVKYWFAALDDTIGHFGDIFDEFRFMFFDNFNLRWDALMSKLDELSGSDEELSNQSGAMKDQASQMQQANDTLNSVSKPVINADAMLDQYLNFNSSGLAILSIVSNNAFATSMLVVVFTFALCGYIFFGKKR